jgi:hypothetical protein
MEKIPTFQTLSSKFRQEIILGDRLMELVIRWNSRSESWFMDIADITDQNVTDQFINGIRLVPNWLLLRQYRSYFPDLEGDLILLKVDEAIEKDEVTYDNLGNGMDLLYADADEAEEWEDFYGLG